jgi:hypothetical protein
MRANDVVGGMVLARNGGQGGIMRPENTPEFQNYMILTASSSLRIAAVTIA